MSGIEIPEEPKGIGSIIRVVFKAAVPWEAETFYVGKHPGVWVEYGGDASEFNWKNLVDIIKYDEAEVFEVVYEGLGTTEKNDAFRQHIKDWIWGEGL